MFRRTSILRYSLRRTATFFLTSDSSVMSQTRNLDLASLAARSSATPLPFSSTSKIATLYPLFENNLAVAAPIPLAPPVMRANLPALLNATLGEDCHD